MPSDRAHVRGALLTLGLAAAFGLGLWLPQHLKTRRVQARIVAAQKQLALEQQGAGLLTALAREVEALEAEAASMRRTVADQDDQAPLLRQLDERIRQRHLAGVEVQVRPLLTGVDFGVVPVDLRFEGGFPAVYGLLHDIENEARLIRVQALHLENAGGKGPARLTARVELGALFAPREATP